MTAPSQRILLLSWANKAGKFVLAQYLIIGFATGCVLGYFFPTVAEHGGVIRSEFSILYGAVAFIFLVSGLQIPPAKLQANATNWRLHVIVQGMSFIAIPAIVLAVVHISIAAGALETHTPSPSVLIGMLVTSCIPTTIASNVVMTRSSGGDEAAAVVSVVVGNVVGSFLAPLLVFALYPRQPEFEALRPADPSSLGTMYARVAKQLGLSVVLPLAAGQAVRWRWEARTLWVLERLRLAKASTLCLALLVWTTFSGAFGTGALFELSTASILFNVFLNVALYGVYTVMCFFLARPPGWCLVVRQDSKWPWPRRMSREQTVAVCFCGAAKTTSVGIPMVSAMWTDADDKTRAYIQIPVLLFTIEQVFMAQGLVYFFRWYLKRGQQQEPGESGSGDDTVVGAVEVEAQPAGKQILRFNPVSVQHTVPHDGHGQEYTT